MISEREILDYCARTAGPVRLRDLVLALQVPRRELRALKALVRRLRAEGKLQRTPRARGSMTHSQDVIGRLQGTRRDFAFLLREDAPDLRVRAEKMRDAVHGDIVRAQLHRFRGRLEAVVVEVVQRGRQRLAGTLVWERSAWWLVADEERISRDIRITGPAFPSPAQAGHKALVRITGHGPDGALYGTLDTVLGPVDTPGVRTQALVAEFDLPGHFDAALQASVDAMRPPDAADLAGREDFRALLAFTIDPVDAKDHDDAVSIVRLEDGGFELGVHIADVAHYVEPGSLADLEAESRATSVYLADRVIPMLPELLSNHVCSLRPGVPRLVQSALMRYDHAGALQSARLARGMLVSRVKLSYEAAETLLQDGEPEPSHLATFDRDQSGESPWPGLLGWESLRAPVRQALHDMRHLARSLRAQRFAHGALGIDSVEYRVHHDATGRVVDITRRLDLESYRVIEEFMLQANQVVARALAAAGLPLLWRAHDEPEFQSSEELRLFLKKLGIVWAPENPVTNRDYQTLLHAIEHRRERRYLMFKILRSLQKARYDGRQKGHFGLSFSKYTHFTSPIRRYPDLYNHRLVQQLLAGRERGAHADAGLRRGGALMDLGRHTSAREVRAAEAERASLKLKLCEFLADRVGDETEGVVSSITTYGFYVDLPAWNAEGLVHVRQLGGEDFVPDPQGTVLRSSISRRVFHFGQPVHVRLARVDPDRRQIDLCLAD